MQAVILAGGRGSRLDPFSRVLPKPLFPVGNRPLAAILVCQLQAVGFSEIVMCLGYCADIITAYFQDGSGFGIPVRYVVETAPLGTAGPLKKISGLADNFLVVNGDELTTLNFRRFYDYHLDQQAIMSVAVQEKNITASFGVLELQNGRVVNYREKPALNYWASMGIYMLNRQATEFLPDGKPYDMPNLVQALLANKAYVAGFPSSDLWFDIGTMNDLEKAKQAVQENPALAEFRNPD